MHGRRGDNQPGWEVHMELPMKSLELIGSCDSECRPVPTRSWMGCVGIPLCPWEQGDACRVGPERVFACWWRENHGRFPGSFALLGCMQCYKCVFGIAKYFTELYYNFVASFFVLKTYKTHKMARQRGGGDHFNHFSPCLWRLCDTGKLASA